MKNSGLKLAQVMKKFLFFFAFLLLSAQMMQAQNTGTIRGNVFDKDTGEPIIYGSVRVADTDLGVITDLDGFFTFASVAEGKYTIIAYSLGYDSTAVEVAVVAGKITYERIVIGQNAVNLQTVNVSAEKEKARSDVQVSKVRVTPKQIRSLPSTGGESDIAQYLPVLPGVIVSGDQGGQLYIRGGSPIQNKILLDGMTIYNPFHSIGFFSVFETEAIKSVDVLTGGFNAEYGGRISAVVDIKTKEGNKKRFSGLASASPFQGKLLLEGPIKKLNNETGASISYLVTGKHSYLNQTSKVLYDYATDTSFYSFAAADTSLTNVGKIGLPYSYTDFYGKVSIVGGNGSKINLFGFSFNDRFNFLGLADLKWNAFGSGADFTLVPPSSNLVINGTAAFSNYDISLLESDGKPRQSSIKNYFINMNFTYFGKDSQINYGFEFNGFNTDFLFYNTLGLSFQQKDFTNELSGYLKLKRKIAGRIIFEPGIRFHYYASQSNMSVEPRLGLKYNASTNLRFKFAAGLYSQNLISTVNELDVVNFFVGFLSGPEEQIFKLNTSTQTDHRLQKASHAIAGVEIDVAKSITLNVEGYLKRFNQLISINRNKLSSEDPDFVTEKGDAYGVDFSLKYEKQNLYLWMTYSLGYVNRDDGYQVYPTVFDRRHNVNTLITYNFGKNKAWEASGRWNLGSGFPFTQTQGFYENIDFSQLLYTDILTGNFNLGTILSEERNGGRLSWYHRLDFSLKRSFKFSNKSSMEAVFSLTNAYNRKNIFYVDRITNNRVNQLPIIPSLGLTFKF
jgi:hypothetical protein